MRLSDKRFFRDSVWVMPLDRKAASRRKWDPILAKVSKFFAKFLSEIPFLFLAGVLFNSIWILPNRLPPLFPNFSQIFKESHFTVRTLQRLKHTKIPFYRIPILPRELCSGKTQSSGKVGVGSWPQETSRSLFEDCFH